MVDILGTLDDKIENNSKEIEEYEHLLELYFTQMLSEKTDEWDEQSLLDIAEYTNGLAMQKFRPRGSEYLPVVKIKELSQGRTDNNSEQADIAIGERFIIDDGDIIFAWSGTLMVKIWCGGKAGLNQHLFKVTSPKYSKWFIYLWTKYHLIKFQNIAKGKAVTMGHIKREDLANSVALIPTKDVLKKYESIISPLFDRIVLLHQENKTLFSLNILKNIDYSSINKGSTQPLITQTDIRNTPVYIPDLNELLAFEDKHSMFLIQMYKDQIGKTKEIKNLFLQKFFG